MSQTKDLLNVLKDGVWHSSYELAERVYHGKPGQVMSCNLTGRISDCRKLGHTVISKRDGLERAKWWYRLVEQQKEIA